MVGSGIVDTNGHVTWKSYISTQITVAVGIVTGMFGVGIFILSLHSQAPHPSAADRDDVAAINERISTIQTDVRDQRRDIREILQRIPRRSE